MKAIILYKNLLLKLRELGRTNFLRLGIYFIVVYFTYSKNNISAQVNITTGSYTQGFGTVAIPTWVDNTTFLGWYMFNSASPMYGGELNITAAAPTNTGKNYAYTCNGGTNRKIGSRASGGTNTCCFGVLLRNMTGSTIQSFLVNFTAFQMSLGGNTNANPNTLAFEYIIGAAPIAVNADGGNAVISLDYLQSQFTGAANTSSQIQGFPCTISESKMACINATLLNGNYILLRWVDADDPANDPHFAIDDLSVAFDLTGATCVNFLPIELLSFNANYHDEKVNLNWSTSTEINNEHFIIERSSDATNFESTGKLKGKGASNIKTNYQFIDQAPSKGVNYYRLQQVDFNGESKYSNIISLNNTKRVNLDVFPNPSINGIFEIHSDYSSSDSNFLEIFDYSGKKLFEKRINGVSETLDLSTYNRGIYVLKYNLNGLLVCKKLIIN